VIRPTLLSLLLIPAVCIAAYGNVRGANDLAVELHFGAYKVTYWAANGPDARRLTPAEYEHFRKASACGSDSHVSVWVRDREVQVLCEL
jgi:hypothetical protein